MALNNKPLLTWRVQCANITRGCGSTLQWVNDKWQLDEGYLTDRDWWKDNGLWVCNEHPQPEGIPMEMQIKAIALVVAYYNQTFTNNPPIDIEELFLVWFSKTLKNWKCLIATARVDKLYFEVTYNGEMQETYVDCYQKLENMVFTDKELAEEREIQQDPLPDISWVTTDKLPQGTIGFPWSNPK